MSDAYFTNAVDQYWDTPGNWFADSGFTTPLSTWDGLPDSYNDIYVYGTINGYVSTPPNPLSHGYFYGNGMTGMFATYCALNLTFSSDVVFNNGYSFTGYYTSLTCSGTVTFNNNSAFGNGAGGYYYGNTIYASSVVFNDTSGYSTYGGNIYGTVTLNNGASLGDITFQNNTTLNDSSSIYWNGLSNNQCYGILSLKNTSSVSYITLYNDVLIYYPGTATISNYTFMYSNTIRYADYPTLYLFDGFYNGDWANLDHWWVNSIHNQKSANLPSSSTDVVVDTTINSISSGTATCDNLSVTSSSAININISVATLATFNDSSHLNTGYTITGNCLFTDSSYNAGTVDGNATFLDTSYNDGSGVVTGNATFGVNSGTDSAYNSGTINGTSTFYASCYAGSGPYFGGAVTFRNNSYTSNGSTINNSSTLSFYDNSLNYSNGIIGTFTCDFNNNATNYIGAAVDTGVFNNNSSNLGSCNNATYNNASVATSATYSSNLNISISGDPVNNYTMDTSTYTYTFTRGAGGGGGGINGSSILGIL